MTARERRGPPPPSDPEAGIFEGRTIARRFTSPDGFTVLVGKTASDNDDLSLRLAAPADFWLHVASESGSHVVVRNPDRLPRLPRETLRFAASLAAAHSKARKGGKVAVHVTTAGEVRKPRGLPAGKVEIRDYDTVFAAPWKEDADTAKP